jgi:CRISPR-associated protein Csh2
MTYNKRIFGAAIVKASNSNYNADFSGQPRTLPDGTVYATDKAFKYAVKNYIKDVFSTEKIFVFKSFNEDVKPLSLDENFIAKLGEFPTKIVKKEKKTKEGKTEIEEKVVVDRIGIAKKLLSCIDVRYFGATYAGEENISIHGPVQINHGVNIWHENDIFSEQIMSPYRNSNESSVDSEASTLGRQSKLKEGHYLHHFSINPKNIEWYIQQGAQNLTEQDITKLKEAMGRGVTWYDSASKAGSENEALIWITLKENSKLVLPNLTQLVTMKTEKEDGKVVLDCEKLKNKLAEVKLDIETVELAYNKDSIIFKNIPDNCKITNL